MPRVEKQTSRRRKKGVLSRIKKIGFDESQGIKINIYGKSGTGKTTLWATFPKPILAMICSGGKQSGELRSIDTPEYRKTVQQVIIEDADEVRQIIDHQKETGEYATIVLDHVTDFQNLILKDVLGLEKLPEQKSWGMATQQQYGTTAFKMKEYLRGLLDLECNICLIGQERVFESENESELIQPFIASAVTKSVVGWLNPAVDYVVQTFIRQKTITKKIKVGNKTKTKTVGTDEFEYCLRTSVDSIHEIKFRVPKDLPRPEVIIDPTYDKIIDTIKGR